MEGFGRIQGLAVGPRGSVSKDLNKLIATIAQIGAERKWQMMGARNPLEARAVIKGRLRRSVGITAVVAEAMLRSDRLGIALGNGSRAAKRRMAAKTWFWRWRDEMFRQGAPVGGAYWPNYG